MRAHKITDPGQELEVEKIIMHEDFVIDATPIFNDIALLKLKTRATLGTGVGLVCLPREPFSTQNMGCYITGWGSTESFGNRSIYLQEASVTVMNPLTCQTESQYPDEYFIDSVLCAGAEMVDACQGDGGGPLVCGWNGKWHLVGATSYGFLCGEPDFPGIYTDVYFYRDWVNDKIASN